MKELGAGGVQIFTNVAGRPLDDPAFEPIFATMAEFDLPIWLHPARTASMPDYPAEQKSRFEMWWCFGWPYDTSVAMVRMVFAGLLDRYPGLKIITHHLGGMIPFYDGRIGPGLQVLGSRTSDEDYSKILPSLKRPHLDYLHDFYGDTALFGGGIQAVRCGLEFFGSDHVVFATDTPLGPIAPTIEVIAARYRESDRHKIFCGNAERLLKKNVCLIREDIMARMLALLAALGCLVSAGAQRAGLSGQDHHHRGAGLARRRDRHARPHAGAALHRGLGPAGDRREPARRQQPDRRRIRHQVRARRPHAVHRAGDDVRGQSEPLSQAAVRSGQELHADHRPGHHQPRADRAPVAAGRTTSRS